MATKSASPTQRKRTLTKLEADVAERGVNVPPGAPSGPIAKRRKFEAEEERSVINSYGAPLRIKQTRSPMAQQGSIIYNAKISFHLPRYRKTHQASCAAANYPGSEYPDGGANVYNIVQRELVFRSVKKSDIDPRYVMRSAGQHAHNIWSSFNLLPRDEEPVFIGIADTGSIIAKNQTGEALNEGVAVAVHGTRTLTIGPEAAHLGDQLYWDYPWSIQRASDPNSKRPGLDQQGVPNDKFVAWLRPMSFDDFGSSNMYRNVASYFMGTFNPDGEQNKIFAEYRTLQMVLEHVADDSTFNVGIIADGVQVQNAAMKDRIEAFCDLLSKLCKRPAEDLIREHNTIFKVMAKTLAERAAGPASSSSSSSVDLKQTGQPSAAAAAPAPAKAVKLIGKASIIRLIQLQIEHNRAKHANHFLKRRVGMALSSGVSGPIDVYVRGGVAY